MSAKKNFKPLKFEDLEISEKDLKNIVLGSQLFLTPLDETDEKTLGGPLDTETEEQTS